MIQQPAKISEKEEEKIQQLFFDAFLEDVLIFPEFFHFFFSFHKLKVCGDFVIHPWIPPFLILYTLVCAVLYGFI